ncbi:S1 RNA-binding domain-containing protein, partial [Thalassospira sp. UBA848]
MVKRMLIDATHAEESRVVVIHGNRLEEYDVETSTKKQIKGNIYLAKVTRVEPSLQAAFVDYGGNRHGFLAFSEIHSDYYQIPVADREAIAQGHAQSNAQVKDAEIVEDNIGDGDDSQKKEKKPSRSRSRRKPRTKDKDEASDTPNAESPEAEASTDAPAQSEAATDNTSSGDEEDAKPRRRRPRNRRKKSDEVEASGSNAEENSSTDGN